MVLTMEFIFSHRTKPKIIIHNNVLKKFRETAKMNILSHCSRSGHLYCFHLLFHVIGHCNKRKETVHENTVLQKLNE